MQDSIVQPVARRGRSAGAPVTGARLTAFALLVALGACSAGSEPVDIPVDISVAETVTKEIQTEAAAANEPVAEITKAAQEAVTVAPTQPEQVSPTASAEAESAEEEPSPDFELATLDGKRWRLADQGDRPKLIMFWGTWCPFCKKIFPTVQEIHETYSPELSVAAISIRETGNDIRADIQAYVDQRGLTMPILVEGDDVGNLYQVPGTPAILLLDGDNLVVLGTLDSNPDNPELRNAVDAVMAERAAASS